MPNDKICLQALIESGVSLRRSERVRFHPLNSAHLVENQNERENFHVRRTNPMKILRWVAPTIAVAALNSQLTIRPYADIFKLDLGECQNGGVTLSDWTVIPTFLLDTNGVYQLKLNDFDPFSTT